MDDETGYGSRRGPGGKPDADGDNDGDVGGGFAGESAAVTKHPIVDHNGHRGDARGHCVGCGSARCMGGCGSGAKRM